MNGKWPKAKLIFLLLILAVGGYWLFIKKSRFKNEPVIIKQGLYGLKNRNIKKLQLMDSLSLNKACNEVLFYNDTVYLTPFDVLSDKFQYYKYYSGQLHEIKLTDKATTCQSMTRQRNAVLFLLRNEEGPIEQLVNNVYVRSNSGVVKGGNLDIPCEYDSQADDSCYYVMTKKNRTTFLYKYNYHLKELVDSLNLNTVFNTSNSNLKHVLTARLSVRSGQLIFKTMYSSVGLIIDKYNFRNYTPFKSIDSLQLPEYKRVDLGEGVIQHQLEPEIMVTWRMQVSDSAVACLSFLDYEYMTRKSKVNCNFLDIYDAGMRYSHSFRLPPHNGHQAFSTEYCPSLKILFVLYDDQTTLLKFRVHE